MAAVMRVRVGFITRKIIRFSYNNSSLRDNGFSHFHRSARLGVVGQDVKMPSLSPTMTEGTILKWLKNEGDNIVAGDVICEIQTDKAVMSYELEEDGVLAKILIPENTPNVKVGSLIAVMVGEGEDWTKVKMSEDPCDDDMGLTPPSPPSSSSRDSGGSKSGSSSGPKSGGGSDSGSGSGSKKGSGPSFNTSTLMSYGPAVRSLLEKFGLKADEIEPTGYRKKLLKEDVVKHIKSKKLSEKPLKSVPPPTVPKSSAKAPKADAKAPKAPEKGKKPPPKQAPSSYTDIPVSGMRKTIARRLLESKTTIPHAYGTIICDVKKILDHRVKLKEDGIRVSVNDYIVKAAGCTLQYFPEVNAHYIKDKVQSLPSVDISIAVATPSGLITPIVTNVPGKGLTDVSASIKDLAKRARDGKLKPSEYQGGSFTISNLGMYGIKEFIAIINPPQCAILAVGTGRHVLDKDLRKTTEMRVTLSYDSRAFDEAVAAEFLKGLQTMLQDPAMMIVGGSSDLRHKVDS